MERLGRAPGDLLGKLSSTSAEESNAAADRLTSPEFGLSASTLVRLGFSAERQSLVEGLREKALADDHQVRVRKAELVTRDIGTAKVESLGINTSLQFEFFTERSGYVTLLNLGTSGAVYVHVPNAYVNTTGATVDAGRVVQVPGAELLPWEELRRAGLDYVEIGPPGWEHIAVIVSTEPLVSEQLLDAASPDAPFLKLSSAALSDTCQTLASWEANGWSVGILSFLVA